MKWLSNSLAIIGLVILAFATIGRFSGNPGAVIGMKIMSLMLLANTMFLLAILVKDLGKK